MIKNRVDYHDIIMETFVYTKIHVPEEFSKMIWNLSFPDTGTVDGEVRYKFRGSEHSLKNEILEAFKQVNTDGLIWNFIESFTFDINKMVKGEYIPMHNEVSQKSPFEVLLWLTRTDDFEGREFIMENNGVVSEIKPVNGLVCFLDTTSPHAYHGVRELISDTEIITIVGGLGRKNGYGNKKDK